MQEVNKNIMITCPHCGTEYFPCEIFYPKDFFGNVTNVVRDESGKIISWSGTDMNLEEEFICEHCGKTFKTKAYINFETEKVEEDTDTVTITF